MRRLIVIRIVHTPSDMGSASAGLERSGISALGRRRWEENQMRIERFWQEVEKEVDGLGLDYARLCIYQDACPVPALWESESSGRRPQKEARTTR